MSLSGGQLVMALYKYSAFNSEFPSTERRGGGIVGAVLYSLWKTGHGLRAARRGRRFGRVVKPVFLIWVLLLAALFFVSLSVFGLKLHFPGNLENRISSTLDQKAGQVEESGTADSWEVKDQTMEVHIVGNEENRNSVSVELQVANNGKSGNSVSNEVEQQSTESRVGKEQRSKHRRQHFPCEVGFAESVDYLTEPKDVRNFTQFSLKYVASEEKIPLTTSWKPRFGGHRTLEERERSFYATDQTLHCGFVKGPAGLPSTGFDLSVKDKKYMDTCWVVVSSCIFGNSDFLRRPTSRKISEFSKKIVCFVMFVDEQTLSKLSSDGHVLDDKGFVGLWRIVVVRNLPYEDMRRTGKVPKFLSHRLFPSARYSIWLDSKMRLNTDPMLILEYFLWRTQSEYAISNHYDRRCVWEEVLQNKRLNKYNHTAIDEQFNLYQSDGLTKFDPSDPNTPLPSYVPEGSFIVRAHTPMSNLFSCLWFNEVDRFTSRDQLSFAYTYLKLRRLNPDHPFYIKMFKDCERRALAKLFHHRITPPPPPGPG